MSTLLQKSVGIVASLILLLLPITASADSTLLHLPQGRYSSGPLAVESYQYLWFSAKENNPVRFTLNKKGNLWYRFKILNNSANQVLLQADVETNKREVTFAPPYDGDYYILLLGYFGYGKYDIRFKNVLTRTLPNSSSESPLRFGINRFERSAVGVQRRFAFFGSANEPVRLNIEPEREVWLRVRILDPQGRVVRTIDVENHPREIIYTPQTDGKYVITIAGYFGDGQYSIKLDLIRDFLF